MVLDDASPQAGSGPAASPSRNSASRVPSGPNPALARYFPVKIKPELVVQPDPMTLYLGFLGSGNWKRNVARTITDRVENVWLLTNRAPTQEEMDAFTTHSTRSLYYRRIGLPLSTCLGTAWLWHQARKAGNIPGDASPQRLLSMLRGYASNDSVGFRQGVAAAAFKMLFITTFGTMMSHGAAFYSDTKSVLTDPRLKNFVEDMTRATPEDIRRRKLQAMTERARNMRSGQQDIGTQIKDGLGQGNSYGDSDQGQYSYDASPSASDSPQDDTSYDTTQSKQYNGSDDQSRSAPNVTRRPQVYGNAAGQQEPASQPSSGSDFFFGDSGDDASPTAPEYRNTNMDGSSGGNAWDRVRQQNAGPSSQSGPARQSRTPWGRSQPPQPTPPSESPYNELPNEQDRYSSERRLEKEQAQADFDRMVDAERSASTDTQPQSKGWWS